MKKLLAIFISVAIFAACNNDAETTTSEANATSAVDSTTPASALSADSATGSIDSAAAAIVDSARINSAMKGKKTIKK